MKSMGRTPWWLWPNLLSLDAPILAVLWQDFLSHRYAVPLRLPGRLALFLTVWAIYVADRLLDSRHPVDRAEAAELLARNTPVRQARAGT